MDMLLIGDGQPGMIARYLHRARLFIGLVSRIPVACCAVTEEPGGVVEIKNLAVAHNYGHPIVEEGVVLNDIP